MIIPGAITLQEMLAMVSLNPVSVERALPAEVENSIVFTAEEARKKNQRIGE
jgi:hypothetical protein